MSQRLGARKASDADEPLLTLYWAALRLMRTVATKRLKATDDGVDLGVAQYYALVYVCDSGPLRMGELARVLSVPVSTATRIMDRLVDQGYVLRRSDPTDRRSVLVEATKEGHRLLARERRRRVDLLREVVVRLDAAERAELTRLFSKLGADDR